MSQLVKLYKLQLKNTKKTSLFSSPVISPQLFFLIYFLRLRFSVK